MALQDQKNQCEFPFMLLSRTVGHVECKICIFYFSFFFVVLALQLGKCEFSMIACHWDVTFKVRQLIYLESSILLFVTFKMSTLSRHMLPAHIHQRT